MDKPSHSPPSSDSSGDEGETLTPVQRGAAATLSSSPPLVVRHRLLQLLTSHPAPNEAGIVIELAKARFGDYLKRVEKKHYKGKAKK